MISEDFEFWVRLALVRPFNHLMNGRLVQLYDRFLSIHPSIHLMFPPLLRQPTSLQLQSSFLPYLDFCLFQINIYLSIEMDAHFPNDIPYPQPVCSAAESMAPIPCYSSSLPPPQENMTIRCASPTEVLLPLTREHVSFVNNPNMWLYRLGRSFAFQDDKRSNRRCQRRARFAWPTILTVVEGVRVCSMIFLFTCSSPI
ncbi:uncharacterized protein LY89DRAFT_362203 [Mollisia scopiformis]|uniref:Uncharacterized protein n=1 Tax=Mollisia scopiformis TaxID=149040 RepID=A0A132B4F5_MOLSC|nr:uncharacterized protein LY89DRAFT_362203 [Mollisia scopiformis]KUJ07305.1 hypothetical protein LY89DRAFT_362203 [Mollisia scopiformis]